MTQPLNTTLFTAVIADPWSSLCAYTPARIALGRTGAALPLKASLRFSLAHAHARDAVYTPLQKELITQQLNNAGIAVFSMHSEAADRDQYLQRPDMGRRLEPGAAQHLPASGVCEDALAIVIADGLSATAVNTQAVALVQLLMRELAAIKIPVLPVILVQQGRVAIGDAIGSQLQAACTLVLIGERPGLSAASSMGAYLTFGPKVGLTDDARNCVSNIHPGGLSLQDAAAKIMYLLREAYRRGLSGVLLKEESTAAAQQLPGDPAA
ncbi:ethanolamine ammonia-lyase subunit EutC [Deminuibacter soli]|uniref:Ethanolamine ammonia-lyase small subunit n=1 Tax=Deminuibacter soli TaxID=2291815 RepID=A0A3E1NE46_9BACT|nr:ethanolamine ammonia-lyase subunit EutC [Deminuibacter soli]RFM26236.1 ethanolamine ammonia-lyase subunit EutC [Deminuibacter soli]